MNGPFTLTYFASIQDDKGVVIAKGEGENEEAERKNAEAVCAALNAMFYMSMAIGGAA